MERRPAAAALAMAVRCSNVSKSRLPTGCWKPQGPGGYLSYERGQEASLPLPPQLRGMDSEHRREQPPLRDLGSVPTTLLPTGQRCPWLHRAGPGLPLPAPLWELGAFLLTLLGVFLCEVGSPMAVPSGAFCPPELWSARQAVASASPTSATT